MTRIASDLERVDTIKVLHCKDSDIFPTFTQKHAQDGSGSVIASKQNQWSVEPGEQKPAETELSLETRSGFRR